MIRFFLLRLLTNIWNGSRRIRKSQIAKRINDLIKDIHRSGILNGIGKPEALKGIKAYSRRIDASNRLVYIGDEKQNLKIISCKGHYQE